MRWLFFFIPWMLFPVHRKALFSSLEPNSIRKNLAFYEIYQDTEEGEKALQRVLGQMEKADTDLTATLSWVQAILPVVNRSIFQETLVLSADQKALISQITQHLHHRKLKGSQIFSEKEIFSLTSEDIDLARALLVAQGKSLQEVESYEAVLDLMALEILNRSPSKDPYDLIDTINQFLFFDLEFRFPPKSLMDKEIDRFTLLSDVLDSRKGVCLGVSILYLCLAQRIGLPLDIITPPGHIYISYQGKRNIETTARGIHLPTKRYLDITTKFLKKHSLKEVIGLSFTNEAAKYFSQKDYQKAFTLYKKAWNYLEDRYLCQEFLAFTLYLLGQKEQAKQTFSQLLKQKHPYFSMTQILMEDLCTGIADVTTVQAVFENKGSTTKELYERKKHLAALLKHSPKCRTLLMELAFCSFALGYEKTGLGYLQKYHDLDPYCLLVEYYLCVLHWQRWNHPQALIHFHQLKKLLKEESITSVSFQQLQQKLSLYVN